MCVEIRANDRPLSIFQQRCSAKRCIAAGKWMPLFGRFATTHMSLLRSFRRSQSQSAFRFADAEAALTDRAAPVANAANGDDLWLILCIAFIPW